MFTYVNEDRLNVNTYKTFIDLLDNYNHVVKEEEFQPPESLQEIETYLDEILLTEVMNITFQYLVENGMYFTFI